MYCNFHNEALSMCLTTIYLSQFIEQSDNCSFQIQRIIQSRTIPKHRTVLFRMNPGF